MTDRPHTDTRALVTGGSQGLGLAIAAELVRGHGGQLLLERTGPEGTVFAIRLPKVVVEIETAAE